jgi:hypothetical protein
MEDLERQIPYSLEKTWSQIPGVCLGGGGVLKFRIDRYIKSDRENICKWQFMCMQFISLLLVVMFYIVSLYDLVLI